MFLHEFPDLNWLKTQVASRFASRKAWNDASLSSPGWPSVILHANSRQMLRDNITGPLSVFCTLQGESWVETTYSRARISPQVFYLSNAGQQYTLGIEEQAETFNVHFGEQFLSGIQESYQQHDEALLDLGYATGSLIPEVPNHSFVRNDDFNSALSQLYYASVAAEQDPLLEEELLTQLAATVMQQSRAEAVQAAALPTARAVTRRELNKRLRQGIDFMHSYYQHPVQLDDVSRACGLSKFHFLRSFKQLMRLSPYQYLLQLRLSQACYLLTHTPLPIMTIALQTGFDNEVSFARAFRRKLGQSATQYRQFSNNGKVSLL